jgi:hypothetical protein
MSTAIMVIMLVVDNLVESPPDYQERMVLHSHVCLRMLKDIFNFTNTMFQNYVSVDLAR